MRVKKTRCEPKNTRCEPKKLDASQKKLDASQKTGISENAREFSWRCATFFVSCLVCTLQYWHKVHYNITIIRYHSVPRPYKLGLRVAFFYCLPLLSYFIYIDVILMVVPLWLQGLLQLQAMKGANSVFRHTATPPELYRHTPTPPDKHLLRYLQLFQYYSL